MTNDPNRPYRPSGPRTLMSLAAMLACAPALHADPAGETIRIGASPSGVPLEVIALGETGENAQGLTRDERPALLIVAGLQAHHDIGHQAARALADRLRADHPDLLASRTVYILPDANPEGRARWSQTNTYRAETGRAPQPADADRDGRTDEDPPNDLNGDGLITMMRVPAPTPHSIRYNLRPTHLIDPADPRLMREPKPGDAESATHALLIEGLDSDGDGAFNEDGWGGASGGGIDLDKHFPIHWPEHTDGAGRYPLARPEARALVEWAQSRHNIVAVLVYGPHDTLGTVPPAGRFPPPGRVPSGIEEGDKVWYEKISEFYKETTGVTGAGESPDRDGSFLQWAYADLGVFAFGTPVWTRPDLVKADAKKGDEKTDDSPAEPAPQPTTDPAPADPARAEYDALLALGVPPEIAEFITMPEADRASYMEAFATRSVEEQAAMMSAVQALPAEIQARVMAIAQGGADPGPPAASATPVSGPARAAPARNRSESPDAKWLEWFDQDRSGENRPDNAFVDWQPFDHPQLGPVEIGGFVPGVRVNPPEDLVPALIDQQTTFVAGLLERLPALEFDPPTVERVGPGLWRIGVSARNTGLLPSVAAIGSKARRLHPIIFALDTERTIPDDRLVSGSRLARFDTLEGSGVAAHASWLVLADDNHELSIQVRSAHFGNRVFQVRLTDQPQTNKAGGDQ